MIGLVRVMPPYRPERWLSGEPQESASPGTR
jgi:hypothetical protein